MYKLVNVMILLMITTRKLKIKIPLERVKVRINNYENACKKYIRTSLKSSSKLHEKVFHFLRSRIFDACRPKTMAKCKSDFVTVELYRHLCKAPIGKSTRGEAKARRAKVNNMKGTSAALPRRQTRVSHAISGPIERRAHSASLVFPLALRCSRNVIRTRDADSCEASGVSLR